ncbi:hypothetical protein BJ508DRAFT_335455 [Ascobolus immersus RN42]|uniref:Uncharacterized protein n=1 Tax=Ascobolus immersus RN42 TaxID=1160509 RepID=A0A3N4HJB1_ASCIM|nr:hypothetical protein BJ508DRAFT_335455 [Ascobolus immersus RN42]
MSSVDELLSEFEYEVEDWHLGVNSRRRSQSFASSIADSEPERLERAKVEFDVTDIVLKCDSDGDKTTIKPLKKSAFFGYEISPRPVHLRFMTSHKVAAKTEMPIGFSRYPRIGFLELSEDGRHIMVVRYKRGIRTVVCFDLEFHNANDHVAMVDIVGVKCSIACSLRVKVVFGCSVGLAAICPGGLQMYSITHIFYEKFAK